MTKLNPPNNEPYFDCPATRPSPFNIDSLDMGVQEVGHIRYPEGVIYPWIRTNFVLIGWCAEGQMLHKGDFWSVETSPGKAFIIDADLTVLTLAPKGDCECYYLLLDGTSQENLLHENKLWTGAFLCKEVPVGWLEMIAASIGDPEKQTNVAKLAQMLLNEISRNARELCPDPLVWEAQCYLHQHWAKPETNIEKMLSHLRVSRSTLSVRFKAVTGKTMLDYLAFIRQRKAYRMLLDGKYSIKQIANKCGFVSSTHFATWFRKRTGKTPRNIQARATAIRHR